MCTVTSHLCAGRLLVTMNRDERRDRAPEEAPAARPGPDGTPMWIAPLDSQSGGTWIGGNVRGVVACLLNAYVDDKDDRPPSAATSSRGVIIPELLSHGDACSVRRWLMDVFDPTPFTPFTMLVASPEWRELYHWSGQGPLERTATDEGWLILTSSSWNTEKVVTWRHEQFAHWVEEGAIIAGELPTFHLFQPEGLAEWAPLMSREKTATRSITQITADAPGGQLVMRYWASPTPHIAGQPADVSLRLDLAV